MDTIKIEFHDIKKKDAFKLKYAVIQGRYQGKWVLVRHKQRNTYEIPGGHIEKGESPVDAAKRELYEETGAKVFALEPICIYSVSRGDSKASHGVLCYADIEEFDKLPDFEIAERVFFNQLPDNLTYKEIQPHLFNKVISYLNAK